MTNSEAKAGKPNFSPNCEDFSRKWNLTTTNCCCTWLKKSRGTSPEPPIDSLKSVLFRERHSVFVSDSISINAGIASFARWVKEAAPMLTALIILIILIIILVLQLLLLWWNRRRDRRP